MSEIFISYRRDNGSDLASSFEAVLQNNGFQSTIDVGNRYTGDFVEHIKKEITDCTLFIILITKGSVGRMVDPTDNSLMEVEYATSINKPILPIIVNDTDLFKELEENPSLPDCVKRLGRINCRFYKHEMREDTVTYIVDLTKVLRRKKISGQIQTPEIPQETGELLPELSEYMEYVNKKAIKGPDNKSYTYTGILMFKDRLFGEGTLTSLDGHTVYKMVWSLAEPFQGIGTMEVDGVILYTGSVVGLQFSGHGTFNAKDYRHIGNFESGFPKGTGTRIYKNGTSMEGHWIKDSVQKDSTTVFPDGTIYHGKLSEGIPNGYGTMIKGTKRISCFFRGMTNIRNAIIETSEHIFIGDLDSDFNYTGRGILLDKDNKPVFKGLFKNGEPNGKGEMFLEKKHMVAMLDSMTFGLVSTIINEFDSSAIILSGSYLNGVLESESAYEILDRQNKPIVKSQELAHNGKKLIKILNPSGNVISIVQV